MNNFQIDPEVDEQRESDCGLVENKIRAAIRAGTFDNLPGKGKPLKLDGQVHVKPEMRLAFHLLGEAGLAPAWIERQKDLRVELQRFRADLRRASVRSRHGIQNQDHIDLKAECDRLNQAIRNANLEVPFVALHLNRIDFERELSAARDRAAKKKDQR